MGTEQQNPKSKRGGSLKIIIIGDSRFIGKALCYSCIQDSHEVTLFNRGHSDCPPEAQHIQGDVTNLVDYKDQLLAQKYDVVIHCIAYTQTHSEDLIDVFQNTTTHLIVLSSCDCYEAFQGLNRLKDKSELPITEKSQLSQETYYWKDSTLKGELANTYDKNLMTKRLMDSAINGETKVTVLRLAMIYGPGDHQYPSRHGAFIQRILDQRRDLLLSDREQGQIYTYGYIDNIVAAIKHSFLNSVTFGKVYNIGDHQSRSRRRWAEAYAQAAGWKFNFHILPEELLRKDKNYRSAPPQHLLIDSSLFYRQTGFLEPVSLPRAIQATLDHARQNPAVLGPKPNYDDEDLLIQSYYKKLDELHATLS